MRRPLALVGFAYLLTQAVSVLIGTRKAFLLAVVALAAGAIFLLFALASRNRKYAIPVVLLTAAAASFLFSVQSAPLQAAAEAAANQEVRVSGIVCEPPAVDSSVKAEDFQTIIWRRSSPGATSEISMATSSTMSRTRNSRNSHKNRVIVPVFIQKLLSRVGRSNVKMF